MIKNNVSIPIWEKINLTIKEACEYSNIGEKTLRKLLNDPDCPFVVHIGIKKLIKRKHFEKWLDEQEYID